MYEIASKVIKAVEYDPTLKFLTIDFDKGTSYVYSDVPAEIVCELLWAESAGSLFASKIKDQYECQKL